MIEQIDMALVKQHYDDRFACHQILLKLIGSDIDSYLKLALGIDDPCGNYSASEHHLGEPILAENNHQSIINLARGFLTENNPRRMLNSIRNANLKYLKISVGSEMAMMLRPDIFWVGNVRTIWAHLLCKHNYNLSLANEELKLYRDEDPNGEMYYPIWIDIYNSMNTIDSICSTANGVASHQQVKIGREKYMWFDAIASYLYDKFSN